MLASSAQVIPSATMSPSFYFVCFTLLLTHASSYQEVTASRPEMTPDLEEMIVQEGEDLELECHDGIRPLNFSWPNAGHSDVISGPFISDDGVSYKFIRRSMRRADTGWYACASSDKSIKNDPEDLDHDDRSIRWIYVYVNSTEPFVSDVMMDFLIATEGHSLVLPCRTTSDSINVLCVLPLPDPGGPPMWSSFDPKIGCIVTNHKTAVSGVEFICEDRTSGKQQHFMVHITAPIPPPKPKILANKDELLEMVSGNDLQLDCTSDYQNAFTIVWKYPSNNTVGRICQYRFPDGPTESRVYHNQLTLKNITKDDEGTYICEIRSAAGNSFSEINVTIHDPAKNHKVPRPLNNQMTFFDTEGEKCNFLQFLPQLCDTKKDFVQIGHKLAKAVEVIADAMKIEAEASLVAANAAQRQADAAVQRAANDAARVEVFQQLAKVLGQLLPQHGA